MAAEWYGMGAAAPSSNSSAPVYGLYGLQPSSDTWRIDDILDLSNNPADDHHFAAITTETHHHHSAAALADPFSATASSGNQNPSLICSFPEDLYIPTEEAAELEWLSRFVDDSFSEIPRPSYMNSFLPPSSFSHAAAKNIRKDPAAVRFVAKSKRSKGGAGGDVGAANAFQLSPSSTSSSSSSGYFPASAYPKPCDCGDGGVKARRCTHCASEKTPQWRTGPMGPKTLCNACGVRFKSGRLVPEYRPAASPTFVLTQHSNSHRKVLELRRQKEVTMIHQRGGSSAADAAEGGGGGGGELIFRDYEVC